jgi:hypothetical protein
MATLHCNTVVEEAPERIEDMLLAANALPTRRRVARLMETIVLMQVSTMVGAEWKTSGESTGPTELTGTYLARLSHDLSEGHLRVL